MQLFFSIVNNMMAGEHLGVYEYMQLFEQIQFETSAK